jgi:hypothetical protein
VVTLVEPTNVHKIEFNVTTREGPSRVTIVTGTMPISLAAFGKRARPLRAVASRPFLIPP